MREKSRAWVRSARNSARLAFPLIDGHLQLRLCVMLEGIMSLYEYMRLMVMGIKTHSCWICCLTAWAGLPDAPPRREDMIDLLGSVCVLWYAKREVYIRVQGIISNNKPIESSHFRMFQSRHGKVRMFASMFALAAGTPMMQLKVDCGEDTLDEHNKSSLLSIKWCIIPCPAQFHDVATFFLFLEVNAPFPLEFDLLQNAA